MKKLWLTAILCALLPGGWLAAQTLESASDGSGVRGYRDTPRQPWSGYRVHDPDRPLPVRVIPGPFLQSAPVPEDAIVLFGGRDLARWQTNHWRLVDGCVEATVGDLVTKESFGSFQLHLEWLIPTNVTGHLFDRGNNGVLLMGRYEIQIFDSHQQPLYPDGQCAAVYGQTPPLVNACRPPGEWQSYDIIFTAPQFADDKLTRPAFVTVLHNGVLVQDHQEIYGDTVHRELPRHGAADSSGPVLLAGHNCPVRFRNIWLRPLVGPEQVRR